MAKSGINGLIGKQFINTMIKFNRMKQDRPGRWEIYHESQIEATPDQLNQNPV